MTLDDFITTVFCVTDDFMQAAFREERLRKRGPRPTVPDSVVVTCELVGEFLGYDTDSGIYRYIRHHHLDLFPTMGQIHRTTFARQAANLWTVKERLQALLQRLICCDRQFSIIDSFPVPVCRFARACLLPLDSQDHQSYRGSSAVPTARAAAAAVCQTDYRLKILARRVNSERERTCIAVSAECGAIFSTSSACRNDRMPQNAA